MTAQVGATLLAFALLPGIAPAQEFGATAWRYVPKGSASYRDSGLSQGYGQPGGPRFGQSLDGPAPVTGYRFRKRSGLRDPNDGQPRFRPQAMKGRSTYNTPAYYWNGDAVKGTGYRGTQAPVFRPLGENDESARRYIARQSEAAGPFQTPSWGGFSSSGSGIEGGAFQRYRGGISRR